MGSLTELLQRFEPPVCIALRRLHDAGGRSGHPARQLLRTRGIGRRASRIKFADGMSVKLRCHREALDAWWQAVSARNLGAMARDHQTVCEIFK
jgi:hypothetical protein